MATPRIELPKSPLQFGDAEAAPASGGLFGGGGFGDDQFAQLLMGLALLDSGRPRVNPPSAMETIAPLAAMLSQQSNQKNALNFFNSVNKNAPSAAGLLAGGVDASPDFSAFTGMPGSMAPSSAPARGMVTGGAIPGGGVGERVAATLRNRGWSDAAIEGALNNSITESSLNPNATGAAGEKGLFQFHPKSHVSPFTQSYGGDWSPEAQANYVADTVERSMPSYKLAKDGSAATADFMLGFERPKNQSASAIAYRAANGDASRAILGRIGDGTAAPDTVQIAGRDASPPPTQLMSARAAVGQAYAAGDLPDVSPQQLKQAQAAMPNTMAPRSPETVTGARTQAAYAARMFDHWGRAAVGAAMLGTGGAGLVEYAKAQMQLATEFMKPSEAQKNIQMLPPELRPRAAYVLNMKGSPELAGQEEFAKRNAGLGFIGPETAIKEGIQTREEWLRPGASAELAGAKAGATEQAQVDAKLDAMGLPRGTPERATAARNLFPNSEPAVLQTARSTMGNPALRQEVHELNKSGATMINTAEGFDAAQTKARMQIDTSGAKDIMEKANAFRQLTPVLDQAISIATTTPGGWAGPVAATAARAFAAAGFPVTEGMSNAELLGSINQQLIPLVRQPGQQSNLEMEVYQRAVISLSQSQEGRVKIGELLKTMGKRAEDVAKVYRANLGAPDLYDKLAELDKPVFTEAQHKAMTDAINTTPAAATPSGPASTQPGNRVYDPAQQQMVPVPGQPAPQQSTPIPKLPPGKDALDYNSAISLLKQNPTKTNQFYFDQVYGAGAAARELGK